VIAASSWKMSTSKTQPPSLSAAHFKLQPVTVLYIVQPLIFLKTKRHGWVRICSHQKSSCPHFYKRPFWHVPNYSRWRNRLNDRVFRNIISGKVIIRIVLLLEHTSFLRVYLNLDICSVSTNWTDFFLTQIGKIRQSLFSPLSCQTDRTRTSSRRLGKLTSHQ
jgi:hypothetical protein